MVQPTFLCIGAQKAGTMSLINYLSSHPQIYMKKGESHFFDVPKSRMLIKVDFNKYESSFRTQQSIVGEKTPSYHYLQFAIDRIYDYNPNMKLILLLREPISRAWSQYNMYRQMNLVPHASNPYKIWHELGKDYQVKLSNITENKVGYYVARGFYDEHIKYIWSKFPKSNVYIGIAEEIRRNKQVEYNKIFKFLGAKELPTLNLNQDTHIRKYNIQIPKVIREELYKIYRPHVNRLSLMLNRKIDVWEDYI